MFLKLAKFFSEKLGNFSETVIRGGKPSAITLKADYRGAPPEILGTNRRKPQTAG
jgi:hypothetical protein